MPNPIRQENIDAHKALGKLRDLADELAVTDLDSLQVRKYFASVLKALPLRPRPTMAEVDWDDELHYLVEAEHPEYGKLIMLSGSRLSEIIKILVRGAYVNGVRTVDDVALTPTGKRYTLTEVQE